MVLLVVYIDDGREQPDPSHISSLFIDIRKNSIDNSEPQTSHNTCLRVTTIRPYYRRVKPQVGPLVDLFCNHPDGRFFSLEDVTGEFTIVRGT